MNRSLVRATLLAAPLLLLAACSTTDAPSQYSAVLYPSKQVQHDFFTAVDLDEETGEFVGVKHDFTPEDRQIALVVLLDEERLQQQAEVFYELVAPGGFIVEVERQTYRANVPHGVYFNIEELVNKARVVHDDEVVQSGYGEWQGNFYVDGVALGQVEFAIIDPDAPMEVAEEEMDLDEILFEEDFAEPRIRESDTDTTTTDAVLE